MNRFSQVGRSQEGFVITVKVITVGRYCPKKKFLGKASGVTTIKNKIIYREAADRTSTN